MLLGCTEQSRPHQGWTQMPLQKGSFVYFLQCIEKAQPEIAGVESLKLCPDTLAAMVAEHRDPELSGVIAPHRFQQSWS